MCNKDTKIDELFYVFIAFYAFHMFCGLKHRGCGTQVPFVALFWPLSLSLGAWQRKKNETGRREEKTVKVIQDINLQLKSWAHSSILKGMKSCSRLFSAKEQRKIKLSIEFTGIGRNYYTQSMMNSILDSN